MLNADDALGIILDATPRMHGESVPLPRALGRTLASNYTAPQSLPPFDNSSMDGFAVKSSDLRRASAKAPVILNVIGEASAGRFFPRRLLAGESVRIMTGAGVPGGADAVVPLERVTELSDQLAEFKAPPSPGDFIRRAGEDIRRGDTAVAGGTLIAPAELGVLASLGCTRVRVSRRPLVTVVPTGDELVGVDERPGPGQIRNSSSYSLEGFILAAGAVPRITGIARDRRGSLMRRIRTCMHADVLIITGGASVGRHDHVKSILGELGVDLKFTTVNIRPGKPLVFGTFRHTLVFGLPGNPVSTSVTFLEFVRPALLAMLGRRSTTIRRLSACLEHDFSKSDGKRHFLRGIARSDGQGMRVRLTGSQSSGVLTSMTKANCLVIVPEEVTRLVAGDQVEIELL